MAKHRTHSTDFKRQVAQKNIAGDNETLHALTKRHDLSRNLIRIWVAECEPTLSRTTSGQPISCRNTRRRSPPWNAGWAVRRSGLNFKEVCFLKTSAAYIGTSKTLFQIWDEKSGLGWQSDAPIVDWEYGQFVEDVVLWRRIGRVKDTRLPVERIDERST
jgi:hypothetical protein